jgi:uncharacterized NAD(P)/FAD-binding protein YdhS
MSVHPVRPAVGDGALTKPTQTICIVGGGFSGCMVAANLLAASAGHRTRLRIHLIERGPHVGRGAAYATRDPVHLLNVPAKGMSAWVQRPDDFLEWARARVPAVQPGDFLPRRLYADYILDTLERAESEAKGRAELIRTRGEAARADMLRDGSWEVRLADETVIPCDVVVLATGHRPPGDPLGGRWKGSSERWIADPWRPDATSGILPGDPVVIVGTGLTAMDMLLTLSAQAGRSAPVTLISRSGLLPRAHATEPSAPIDLLPILNDLALAGHVTRTRDLFRALRDVIQGRHGKPRAHHDWRAVIDGIRPYAQGLWSSLGDREKRRFLRHVRGLWEVHRHRMAPQIASHVEALRQQGAFIFLRGRIRSGEGDATGVRLRVDVQERGQQESRQRIIEARWAINCSGPSPTIGHQEDRFAASLIDAGLARTDALGMGLETDPLGRPVSRSGRSSGGLWVVGSLRRPALWETTAVPELRAQAETIARECLAALA